MLEIKDVYKSYKSFKVLKGVSFNVPHNEIKGFIGVNGAGKTTLVEIICGVNKMDGGEVFIDNINIKDKKQRNHLKRLIGYMPQSFSLFNDLTVEENLGYLSSVYRLDKDSVDKIIKLCSLEDKRKSLAQNLSGGYRQLLSVAGALIHSPRLLILDEPTSAMDPLFREKFWDIIKTVKDEGMTVLLITHHMEELGKCDSFVCLAKGKVVYDGAVSNFKENGILSINKVLEEYNKGATN